MQTVVIVIHLIVVVFMIGLILIQRSEGGALGIGGGGGGGNFMSARGQANVLTRTTTLLACAFFITSLVLSLIARYGDQPGTILDRIGGGGPAAVDQPPGELGTGEGGLLDSLPGQLPSTAPQAPAPDNSGPQIPNSR